jgi:hypothetical protein
LHRHSIEMWLGRRSNIYRSSRPTAYGCSAVSKLSFVRFKLTRTSRATGPALASELKNMLVRNDGEFILYHEFNNATLVTATY